SMTYDFSRPLPIPAGLLGSPHRNRKGARGPPAAGFFLLIARSSCSNAHCTAAPPSRRPAAPDVRGEELDRNPSLDLVLRTESHVSSFGMLEPKCLNV